MTVVLFQKLPNQDRASPIQALENLSDVFSLDGLQHANNCQNRHQVTSLHSMVFLFYAAFFSIFIFGAALVFWLENSFFQKDWRRHKTRRLEYIESMLQRQKLQSSIVPSASKCFSCDDGPKRIIDKSSSMTGGVQQQQQQQLNDNDDETTSGCCICLEDFCNGDNLCHSSVCPHLFHVKCMKQWLLRQDACPCCRQPYLALKASSDNLEDDDSKTDPSYVVPLDVCWSLAEDLPHWFIMTSEL